jgi:hypothetical protein
MRFLLMMWVTDTGEGGGTADDYAAWMQYETELRDAGAYVAGGALQLAEAATWVTTELSGAHMTRVDETRAYRDAEFGGFYLVDVPDLYTAEEWARRMPTYGDVEVRPLIDYDSQFAAD